MQRKKWLMLKLDWKSRINCVTCDAFHKGILMLSSCYLLIYLFQ